MLHLSSRANHGFPVPSLVTRLFLSAVFALLALFAHPSHALAGNCIFTGKGDGTTWTQSTNWDCPVGVHTPNATTDVVIPYLKDVLLSSQNASIGMLTIYGNLKVRSTLSINGNLTNNGLLILDQPASRVNVSWGFSNSGSVGIDNGAILSVPGTYANSGAVVIGKAGGQILQPAIANFISCSGNPTSAYTTPNTVCISVTDPDRNLQGNSVESMQVSVIQVSGQDAKESETVTLTETSPSSGIFTNTGSKLPITQSATFTPGNQTFEMSASGKISFNYSDTLDASDNTTKFADITVPFLEDQTPPSVSINSPTEGATLSGTQAAINVYATDLGGGVISSVDIQLNGKTVAPITSDGKGNYTAYIDTTPLMNGAPQELKVTAKDNAPVPNTTIVYRSFTVNNIQQQQQVVDTQDPAIIIQTPTTDGVTLSGPTNAFTVNATDSDGVIAKVEFRIGGTTFLTPSSIYNPPTYGANLDTTGYPNGSYTLTATAYDAVGHTRSATRSFFISNNQNVTLPTVSINSPSNNATITNGSTALSVSASTLNGTITGVSYRIDNNGPYGMTFVGSSYTATVNTSALTNDWHTITVTAQDTLGKTNSASMSIKVSNPLPNNTSPSVVITSPIEGAIVSGSIAFVATALNSTGVTFKIDGTQIGSEDTTAPYQTSIGTSNYTNGWHTLSALARDAANHTDTDSIAVYINNVQGKMSDTTNPSVSLLSPKNGDTITQGQAVILSANASDNIGVFGVKFMVDGTQIGSEDYSAPYSVSWNTSGVSTGAHLITAIARDVAGNTSSHSASVTVAGYVPPSLPTLSLSQVQTMLTNGTLLHTLIKLPNDGNPNTQEDSAVYYVGADNKRHAFSNSKVFFTWYCDFSAVTLVAPDALASIPLGKNIPYRPGLRMVKFTTDPRVYVVGPNGQLRGIPSENVAASLYGTMWNTYIDDISDAFYGDYTYGSLLQGASEFNVTNITQGVKHPSDSLNIGGYTPSAGMNAFACGQTQNNSQALDTDKDGLTDALETSIGTNPLNADMDGDGLTDGQEHNIYHTNPFSADTDNDGYLDGQEISNGFNPLGSGKCKNAQCTP